MASCDKVIVDIFDYVYENHIFSPLSYARARLLLLDAFGCAMETLQNSATRSILGPYVPGTTIANGFHLPGTSIVNDPAKGAFDFGTLIRYLDHNDALGGVEWSHPSDSLAAIISVMDWSTRDSASSPLAPPPTILTLLNAMIKAYEIQGLLQERNSFNAHGLDHTILVKIASAAVLPWLLGLTQDQAQASASYAFMDGQPLRTFRAAPNTISRKGWAAGDASMRAVHLVLLVRGGQEGAPHPLTVPKWGFYDRLFGGKELELPQPFGEAIIHQAVVKVIPSEGHALTAAVGALQLSKQRKSKGLDPGNDIAEIKVRTHRPALVIIDKQGELRTAAERDHCMQYIIAVVLLKGKQIDHKDYRDDSPWASDTRVDNLRKKIELKEDEGFSRDYYDLEKRTAPSGIRILLKDGRQLNEVIVHQSAGHPAHPETPGAAQTKFGENVRGMFSDQEVERIKDALENDQMKVTDFVDLWTRPSSKL